MRFYYLNRFFCSTYTEINVASYFRKKKKDPTYKTIYNSKKEMKAAVKAFRKSVMKKGDKKKAESIHYSMEPQLSYSLIDQKNSVYKKLRIRPNSSPNSCTANAGSAKECP